MNIPGTNIRLDESCWQCDGIGSVVDTERTDRNQPRDKTCDICHGAGAILTDAGRELAEFIERQFGLRRRQ
jgi:DnaJ-class molecular chaperone